jgi:hypothetical protein
MRIGALEAGHGWLPFWMKWLDEHAARSSRTAGAQNLIERLRATDYFQSIEMPPRRRLD